MFGIQIFSRTVAKIWNNPEQVLRINLIWFGLTTLLSLPYFLWPQLLDPYAETPRNTPQFLDEWSAVLVVYVLFVLLAYLIGTVIVAIAWHRFVIDDERQDGWLLGGGNWALSRYFWTSTGIILIGMVPLLFVYFGLVESFDATTDEVTGWSNFQLLFASAFCIALPFHIFGPVLPGIAIGRRIGLWQSLKCSAPYAVSLVILTALVAVSYAAPDALISAFIGPTEFIHPSVAGWLAFGLYSATSWVVTLLTVGVMSELFLELVVKADAERSVG